MASQISNGGAIPHATNYSDLLDKVVAFAVSTGGWLVHSDQLAANGEIYLKGLDYSGNKAIYVSVKRFANAAADIYGWVLNGYTGFTNAGFLNNPGAATGYLPVLPLWNDTIPYWCFVNPRRIIVIAKISGVYVPIYLGLGLPYGSTGQWSYPLIIGGSNTSSNAGVGVPRYSDTSNNMCACFIPQGSTAQSPLIIRTPSGIWLRLYNGVGSVSIPNVGTLYTANGVTPYCNNNVNNGNNINNMRNLRPNLDGKYALKDLSIVRGDTPDSYGIFDGVKFVAGYNLSAEDTITEGADVYHVFQDTFRTDLFNFFAVKAG